LCQGLAHPSVTAGGSAQCPFNKNNYKKLTTLKIKIMKSRYFLILLLFSSVFNCFAQETIYDKTKAIAVKNQTTSEVVRITVIKEQDDSYTINFINPSNADSAASFVIKPLQYDTFKSGCFSSFNELTSKEINDTVEDFKILFFDIMIGAMQEEKAPLAGTLKFKDTIIVAMKDSLIVVDEKGKYKIPFIFSIDEWRKIEAEKFRTSILRQESSEFDITSSIKNLNSIKKQNLKEENIDSLIVVGELNKVEFVPSSTQIEFSNGFIQNIAIKGTIENKEIVFENQLPIGFSAARDYSELDKRFLQAKYKSKGKIYTFNVPLADFIRYEKNLRINTRDYCPENGVTSIEMPVKSVKLYKEPTSKILEAKVFTDFVGLQEGEPNGIIQTEVEKRINLLTSRRNFFIKGVNYGWVQYVTPFAVLNKLEDKDKFLELNTAGLTSLSTNFLELLQYEIFRTGVETNAFIFDAPFGKSNICIDGGIAFGKVTATDTTSIATAQSNKKNINTLHLYGKAKFNVIPDERYGITFSYQLGHYNALNNEINYTTVEEDGSNKNWLQNIEMFAFWNIGDSGNLFFRYRLNSPVDNWKYNFSQVQVGYSFNITKQIKSK